MALPREVGLHPETSKKISASIGRFGPYVLHDGKYASLSNDDDVLSVGLNRAVVLLADASQRRRGSTALKELGDHPDNGKPVVIMDGRYGPYIKHGRTNATLPKDVLPEDVTMEVAMTLLLEKAAKKNKGRSGSRKASRASRSNTTPGTAAE